jgi:hypothetical protein
MGEFASVLELGSPRRDELGLSQRSLSTWSDSIVGAIAPTRRALPWPQRTVLRLPQPGGGLKLHWQMELKALPCASIRNRYLRYEAKKF